MAFRSKIDFTTTASIAAPTGTIASDILVIQFAQSNNTSGPFTATGWNLIGQSPTGGSTWGQCAMWALGSVSNFAFKDSTGAAISGTQSGTISAWSGRNTTTPITASAVSHANDGGAVTTNPVITCAAGDDLVMGTTQQNNAIPGAATGTPTVTAMTNSSDGTTGWSYGYAQAVGAGSSTAYTRSSTAYFTRDTIVFSLAATGGILASYGTAPVKNSLLLMGMGV